MVKQIITIATPAEIELVKRHPEFSGIPILITGVGPLNVIRALQDIPREYQVINIGYAGSVDLEIGKEYRIATVELYHKIDFRSPEIVINHGVKCYTASDFVTEASEKRCVFDMELGYIAAMGFDSVLSYKIVSDHCNYSEYEKNAEHK